jgi:ATP-dependent Zn protease
MDILALFRRSGDISVVRHYRGGAKARISAGEFVKRGTKTALIWGALVGIVFLALFAKQSEPLPTDVTVDYATHLVEQGKVSGFRSKGTKLILFSDAGAFSVQRRSPELNKMLLEAGIPYSPDSEHSSTAQTIVFVLLTLGILFGLIVFLRKLRGTSVHSIMELRKTKARSIDEANKCGFADIGGNQQAIELMSDIVDFLRSPEKWTSAGLRIPRGILVIGPPGTGKTLLARAVAGETKSAFLYTSATEFVEMFVGVGAARVRDTFEKAVKQQPAVVFIDEIDAVGRRRGSGIGTMHEEREQTLNQLLVSLDGIEQNSKVVVIAATNRPDVLDSALLRPGRFDRTLRLSLPTKSERLEILKIHTRTKPLDNSLSLDQIADETNGFSGADMEALTNEAGFLAVRRSRLNSADAPRQDVQLTYDDFIQARNEMVKSNRQFDRLESVLVDSVSQFAEPAGPAAARVTLTNGATVEGHVLWMNAAHMKLRLKDGSEVIVAKKNASQIESLDGTATVPQADFTPDRWAGRTLDTN